MECERDDAFCEMGAFSQTASQREAELAACAGELRELRKGLSLSEFREGVLDDKLGKVQAQYDALLVENASLRSSVQRMQRFSAVADPSATAEVAASLAEA